MNIASILNLKFQGIIKALIKFKTIQGFALNVQALVATKDRVSESVKYVWW